MPTPDTMSDVGFVHISEVAPTIGVNGDLWYNPIAGELKISNNGSWIGVGGGASTPPEVEVSATVPVNPGIVIWVDISAPETTVKYLVAGNWVTALDGGRY